MPPKLKNPRSGGDRAGAIEIPIFSTERDTAYLVRLVRFGKVEHGAHDNGFGPLNCREIS